MAHPRRRESVLRFRHPGITRINECIEARAFPRESFGHLLVHSQRPVHVLSRHVVQEHALSQWGRDRRPELPVAGLQDRIRALRQQHLIEQRMIDRQPGSREKPQDALVVRRRDVAHCPRQRRREGHVDGNSVAVSQRRFGRELEGRRPRVPVRNDPVEADFV